MEQPKSSKNLYKTLNNGLKMPRFGLGTYKMIDSSTIKQAVSQEGYRMYDCASFYKNEDIVGKALDELLNQDKTVTR
jgi:diketogulonate reductase-like aldo/keto reductase